MPAHGPIILIDDDEDDQYLIGLALKALQLPNPNLSFANGREALDYLEHTTDKPFLIICDINMPIMNGMELRRYVNASTYLREKAIPFIFLTTAANPQVVQEAYDNAVQGFFKKIPDYVGLQKQINCIIDYWQTCLHPNNL